MRLGRIIISGILLSWTHTWAANWPQWRGPNADGTSDEKNLPTKWGPDENISWRATLPGVGTSTPIVWEDRVVITMQVGKNRLGNPGRSEGPAAREAPDSPGRVQFLVQSYRLSDGQPLWEYRFDAEGPLPTTHEKHNLASPSCVTDGKLIYAWVGTGQLVALTMDGKPAWRRHIGRDYAPFTVRWGHGSSPALYRDSLFLLCDHEESAYLLALDKNTGEEKWKADRSADSRSYTTPFIARRADGDELIINSSHRIDAYDPASGKHLWHVGEPNRVPVPTPVFHNGTLYASRGYRSGPYMAVRTGGRGDVNDSHVRWLVRTGAPYVSSLLYYDGLIYMATESGVATCVDAADGETLWKERLGGYFTASPVAADGKIYLLNEEGETFVLKAGREFNLLHKNELGERTLASPAIAKGSILLRTDEHLLCIRSPGT